MLRLKKENEKGEMNYVRIVRFYRRNCGQR